MDSPARAIVTACLSHRLANAGLPAVELLDHSMHGRQVRADDFDCDAIQPPARFTILIALRFDGAGARGWERMHLADAVEQAATLTRWASEVWPQFLRLYGLD